jgi:asparagine synthase (glutamine-hydrolysing)
MSAQFGIWNFDGRPVDQDFIDRMTAIVGPYGPDHSGCFSTDSLAIYFRAFHTTKESRREILPHISVSGAVITWDGRLDNRTELLGLAGKDLSADAPDVSYVAGAYEKWGTACLAKLEGDWALSIWDPNTHSLILAKDPIGTHPLFYRLEQDQVIWSTVLDPLILLAGKPLSLCEEYIAGWFSFFPAPHLTPYAGVYSVPPSCSVVVRSERSTVSKYWDFNSGKQIRYNSDAEYEEHFRLVFARAVQRRLRSDRPVLAELSGGMDSSSIVCMADAIIARGGAEVPRLDTLSYYDDSEPNWNERAYFSAIEEGRGHVGCHIDVGKQELFKFHSNGQFGATPASEVGSPSQATLQFASAIISQGNRVVLSGIGGDEVTGGVPTPVPELEDLLASAQFQELAHRLKVWAIDKRKPWFHLLGDGVRGFAPRLVVPLPKHMRPAPWLTRQFVKRNRVALEGYENRLKLFGPPPSFQENMFTLDALRRQLTSDPPHSDPPYEKRYPYLDRDLLEFLYAIPREQLVRPGQRRSLMRRALAGIVPDKVLNRKRKAFVVRGVIAAVSREWATLAEISRHMTVASMGIIDANRFNDFLEKAHQGHETPIVTMMRALTIECWLNNFNEKQAPPSPNEWHPSVSSAEKRLQERW